MKITVALFEPILRASPIPSRVRRVTRARAGGENWRESGRSRELFSQGREPWGSSAPLAVAHERQRERMG